MSDQLSEKGHQRSVSLFTFELNKTGNDLESESSTRSTCQVALVLVFRINSTGTTRSRRNVHKTVGWGSGRCQTFPARRQALDL